MLRTPRAKLRQQMIADTEKYLNQRITQPADRFQPILRSRPKGLAAFDKSRAETAPQRNRRKDGR